MWPINEFTTVEHDRCPKHFRFGECACPCDHKGERSVLEREGDTVPKDPVAKTKKTRRKSAAEPE